MGEGVQEEPFPVAHDIKESKFFGKPKRKKKKVILAVEKLKDYKLVEQMVKACAQKL